MANSSNAPGRDHVEKQFRVIRDDFTTLSKLLRQIGEEKAGDKRDAALAEASELLEKSRTAIDDSRAKASQAKASVEDYIQNQPVQSALIALGVGLLVGMMTRR